MAGLSLCNAHKNEKTTGIDPESGEVVPLFNPRHQRWADHFAWIDHGLRIAGKTATGRATVIALRLSDHPIALEVRRYWILVGWHPPAE